LRHAASTAPRCSSDLEMSACPPCQRMSSVRRADPPSCGLPCDSTRSTSPMRSTDFCFPHCLRLRALAPRSFPASLRGLHLAPSPWACTPDDGDWGTWRFKTPDPLQRVAPGFRAAFLLPRAPGATVLLTPLSPTRGPRPAFAKLDFRRASRDRAGLRSVKSRLPLRSGMPSIASLPRHARVAPTLENGHVRFPFR